MVNSVVASHSKGKMLTDKIFGANALAVKAVAEFGKDKVTNATIGALLDDAEQLVCLPTVEKVYRGIPTAEVINYAPIAGLPEYLEASIAHVFGDSKPDAYTSAVATAGGTGVLHHAIWNYSEMNDAVLTTDWYWGTYKALCEEVLRKLDTFPLFDDKMQFNLSAFFRHFHGASELSFCFFTDMATMLVHQVDDEAQDGGHDTQEHSHITAGDPPIDRGQRTTSHPVLGRNG